MRGAHPAHKPVHRELGLVLGHGQFISNDQVGNDFALALELGRLEREAFALIQRDLDLAPVDINAEIIIWAERSSWPARVTSLAHLASNCAWVAVAMYV